MMISFPRGDTFAWPFGLFTDDSPAELAIDNIWFTVKKRYTDTGEASVLIQKTLQLGTIADDGQGGYVIAFSPEDTQDLPFGMYVFDIQVAGDGFTKSFLGTLELTGEVTHRRDEEAAMHGYGVPGEVREAGYQVATGEETQEIIDSYGNEDADGSGTSG